MRTYRLVFLDSAGRPQAYYDIVCPTDHDAVREAKATGYSNEIEVWDGATRVRRVNSREQTSGRGRSAA